MKTKIHAIYSADVKERDKKKLRIRMDIRKEAKAATAVSPEGSLKSDVTGSSPCQDVKVINILEILYVIGDQGIAKTSAMRCNHFIPVLTVDFL